MPKTDWGNLPFEICDAHHHLWDLNAIEYPWLMAKGVTRFFGDPAPIQTNYLVKDFTQDFGQVPVSNSVHIQVGAAPGWQIKEAQWLQDRHNQEHFPSAFMAYCDLEKSSRNTELDQLEKLSAFRGIRQIVGRHPDEDQETGTGLLLSDPQWLAGLQELARRNLRFDLQLIPDQMQQAFAVLSKVPDLSVALCHCGSPWYRDTDRYAMWKHGLQNLASLPNVYCKISGLGMFDHNWTLASLQPVFDTVVTTFGTERCMFGSNFPVDKLYTDYQHLRQSYLDLCDGLGDIHKRDLFGATCRRFYAF